jgi:hypothetical protein
MQTGLLVDSGGGWQQKDLSLWQEKTDGAMKKKESGEIHSSTKRIQRSVKKPKDENKKGKRGGMGESRGRSRAESVGRWMQDRHRKD